MSFKSTSLNNYDHIIKAISLFKVTSLQKLVTLSDNHACKTLVMLATVSTNPIIPISYYSRVYLQGKLRVQFTNLHG